MNGKEVRDDFRLLYLLSGCCKMESEGSLNLTNGDCMQPTTVLLPGGTRKDFSYDALRRISEIKAKDRRVATLLDYHYTYQEGRIVKRATEHGEYNHGYDASGRLTSIISPVENTQYSYDAFGNRSPQGRTLQGLRAMFIMRRIGLLG